MDELTRRHRALRRTSAVALLAVMVVGVTACRDSKKSDTASKATTTIAGTPTTKPQAVVKMSDSPRTSGYVGARKDVTNLTCTQQAKVWKVGGTVTNPTAAPADYRIFTSFLDATNDTRGLLQTDVAGLAPGEARQWGGQLEIGETGLRCILRVERTGVGGAPPPSEAPTTSAPPATPAP